ncbi:MAG: lipoyl synthase [Candidatus Calescibacterium sp.]|nr:lipoyl synthase [Candidatus Calescibacterium sp.]MCX7758206.1 lipoyl synthase [bacterium]
MKSSFFFAHGPNASRIRKISNESNITTVCEDARCPNRGLCWENLSATFLLLGPFCTRSCRFCYIRKGKTQPVNYESIDNFAFSLARLNLKYYTFTMVTRDDLPDHGAKYLYILFSKIKELNPTCYIEVLISDLGGSYDNLKIILYERGLVDVLAHNVETVRRLTPVVRDKRFSYEGSLSVLSMAKQINSSVVTKSSIIVGLGECEDEIYKTMDDLRGVDCDALTIGQYFRPSLKNMEVKRVYTEQEFKMMEDIAISKGFHFVKAGKNVRTSYKAYELIKLIQYRKGGFYGQSGV